VRLEHGSLSGVEEQRSAAQSSDLAAAARLRVAPVPGWVVHEPYPSGENVDDAFVGDGLCLLIKDVQIDLSGPGEAFHMRTAHRVMTAAGASLIAQFSGTFDPKMQEMVVHFLNVRRGERTMSHANIEAFELMRREQNLERRVLDGRRTAALILPDVQPGDIVEQCWTIYTDNPVLRGYFSEWLALEGPPALVLRHRLRAPAGRAIDERTYGGTSAATIHDADGFQDRRWFRQNSPRAQLEDLAPPWQLPVRTVQLADTSSWEDISRHFAGYYAPDGIAAAVRDEAERINAAHPDDPGQRMLEALAFVRGRLRYLSLSLGEGGLVPRPTEQVLTSGYGDCKDSARLFAAVATACGLDAVPALVSSRYGPALPGWLPSVAGFDHCIARVKIADTVYWIDPTRWSRAATAEQYTNALSGWALPLTAAGAPLEQMQGAPAALVLDVREKFTFGKGISQPARLEMRSDYYGLHADWLSEQIANQGLKAVAEHFCKRYRNEWSGIAEAEPMRVEENSADNRVTIIGTYTIEKPWRRTETAMVTCGITDHDLAGDIGYLAKPDKRANEIYLGRPRILRRRVEAIHPVKWGVANIHDVHEVPGLRYSKEILSTGAKSLVQQQELKITAPVAAAGDAAGYCDVMQAVNGLNVLSLRTEAAGERYKAEGPSMRSIWYVVWFGLLLLSMIARLATAPGASTPPEPPSGLAAPAPSDTPGGLQPLGSAPDNGGMGTLDPNGRPK
jgi:hypothetical protein